MSTIDTPRIAVLGAGITGVTTATKLMDRGFAVTLIDRQPYAAMETSFANGGQISASNAEVWNSPGTILKGLKWLFKKDAPLSMNLSPSWHKYSWLAEFIAAIPQHDANTVETARLAQLSREHLLEMAAKANIDFDLERRGILHIYRNTKEFDAGRKVNALFARAGLERQEMTADQLRMVEPNLGDDLIGGFFTKTDFTGDIHKFCNGLSRDLKARGGQLLMETRVSRVRTTSGGVQIDVVQNGAPEQLHVDGVVVCAGVGSRDLAAQLGDRVNIYPVKGYSVTVDLDAASQAAAPWVSLLDDQAKIVTSRLGADRLRIAGTAEFNGANYDIRADRIAPLVHWCRANFPGIETRDVTPWAGLRPMMPNMMPRVGAGAAPGVFYNTGHGHLGWTLAAATAEMVSESVDHAFRVASRAPLRPAAALPPRGMALNAA